MDYGERKFIIKKNTLEIRSTWSPAHSFVKWNSNHLFFGHTPNQTDDHSRKL